MCGIQLRANPDFPTVFDLLHVFKLRNGRNTLLPICCVTSTTCGTTADRRLAEMVSKRSQDARYFKSLWNRSFGGKRSRSALSTDHFYRETFEKEIEVNRAVFKLESGSRAPLLPRALLLPLRPRPVGWMPRRGGRLKFAPFESSLTAAYVSHLRTPLSLPWSTRCSEGTAVTGRAAGQTSAPLTGDERLAETARGRRGPGLCAGKAEQSRGFVSFVDA